MALNPTGPLAQTLNAGGPNAGIGRAIVTLLQSGTSDPDLDAALGLLQTLSGATLQQALTSLSPNVGNTVGAAVGTLQTVGGGTTTISTRLQQTRSQDDLRRRGLSPGDFLTGLQTWTQAYGGTLSQGSRDGFAGFTADSYGFLFGVDKEVQDFTRAGFALGIGHTEVGGDASRPGDTSTVTGYSFNLYGSYSPGPYYVDGLITAGINDNDTARVVLPGTALARTAKGSFDSHQVGIRVNAGLPVAVEGFTITPLMFAQYTRLELDAYTERGAGGLGLTVAGHSVNSAQLGIGVRVAHPFRTPEGTFLPEVRFNYIREVGDDTIPLTTTFVGGGPSFATRGPTVPRDSVNLGLGLTFFQTQAWSVTASYDWLRNDSDDGHSGFGRVRFGF